MTSAEHTGRRLWSGSLSRSAGGLECTGRGGRVHSSLALQTPRTHRPSCHTAPAPRNQPASRVVSQCTAYFPHASIWEHRSLFSSLFGQNLCPSTELSEVRESLLCWALSYTCISYAAPGIAGCPKYRRQIKEWVNGQVNKWMKGP